jgi:epoxyqueuosine reductase
VDKATLSQKIRSLADKSGIDVIGFAAATEFPGYRIKSSQRRDPKLSMPDAKSIIVVGIYIGGVKLPAWENVWYGRTSRLYLSQYFLNVVKPLEPIAEFLKNHGHQAIICDDSKDEGSILPLKLAAIRAGFGWQGKHSLLISKRFGTFLALGGILTDADLEYNTEEESNRCVKCDSCQTACPMGALDQPHVLDRTRCLSSILQAEDFPEEAQAVLGNRVVDCEICQEACPWNRKHSRKPLETRLTSSFQKDIEKWEKFFYLPELKGLSKQEYQEKLGFLNTDIPYHLFQRNVMLAMEKALAAGKFHQDVPNANTGLSEA